MRRLSAKVLAALALGLQLGAQAQGASSSGPGAAPWTSGFGIGASYINQRSTADLSRWIPQMKQIGIAHLRSVNVAWHELESPQGTWRWAELDREVAYLQSLGVSFGLLLMGNPGWNTLDAPGSLPVNNLAGWERYVTAVCQHLRGKTQLIEVWNEPPNGTGPAQRARHYADIVRATYRAAKAVDPSFRIGLAAKSVHVNYLEQVIREGAADHFDYITLHPYELLDSATKVAIGDRSFLNIVPSVRRMLGVVNPTKKDVPVVFTELGIDARGGLPKQARGLVKAYTLSLAQGVAQVQWFEGVDGDSGPLGLMKNAAEPRPAYVAMATLIQALGPAPRFIGRLPLGKGVVGHVFQGPAGPVMVAWGPPGLPAQTVSAPGRVTVNDPAGSGAPVVTDRPVIGPDPRLIKGLPGVWLNQAAQYPRGTWLPEEDMAQAREVSIDFEGKLTTRGLYTLAEADVAASVVGYGGSVRAGTVPNGNLFVVEPSFLNGGPEPLEITVTVRRNTSNRNAGFNLLYEAVTHSGFRNASAGWFTVPEGPGWHSHTWRVDDASFVNQWGYGFALVSDCPGCNDYLLKSVVVRKVGRP